MKRGHFGFLQSAVNSEVSGPVEVIAILESKKKGGVWATPHALQKRGFFRISSLLKKGRRDTDKTRGFRILVVGQEALERR